LAVEEDNAGQALFLYIAQELLCAPLELGAVNVDGGVHMRVLVWE
jgi:hypothetical protein